MGARFDRAFLRFFNGVGRAFGVLCLVWGLAFVAGGVFASADRGVNLGAGVFLLITGAAFLVVKPATREQLERFRGDRLRKDSTDQRGPDEWQA